MLGLSFAVLKRSFQVMFLNFGPLVRVAGWPIIIFSGLILTLGVIYAYDPFDWLDHGGAFALLLLSVPLVFLGMFVCFSWAAVAWHRLILRGDSSDATSLILDKVVWRYTGILFLVVLATLILFYLLAAATLFALRGLSPSQQEVVFLALSVIVYIAPCYVYARLSLIFPGIAVEQSLSIREAWQQSAPYQGALVLVALCLSFVAGFLTIGLMALGHLGGILPAFFLGLTGLWLSQMMLICVVTIFYGHIVEKRSLH